MTSRSHGVFYRNKHQALGLFRNLSRRTAASAPAAVQCVTDAELLFPPEVYGIRASAVEPGNLSCQKYSFQVGNDEPGQAIVFCRV